VLEARFDVDLALFNPDTNSADLSLKRTQCIHNLRKSNIQRWKRWSNVRGRSYSMISLIWRIKRRRLGFPLILKVQLCI
jgi:hypothetical protein